jgi:hypothetical protein
VDLDLVLTNLLSPPVLAFALGVVAVAVVKADVRLPPPVYNALSMYLLLAIGLKGGVALAEAGIGKVMVPALATFVLGVVTPVLAYGVGRRFARLDVLNAGAVAAHYGSVSVVTFTAALAFLDAAGVVTGGFMAALVALLEVPGIIVALFLAARASHGDADWRKALGEVVRGKGIVLLAGGVVIGTLAGPDRFTPVEPFFVGLFAGLLTLFLLELGAVAGHHLRELREAGWRVVAMALGLPVVQGTLGVSVGALAGLGVGDAAVLGAMTASASYIAAPAAVRLALPAADPGIYLPMALGVTFPFNLAFGIPIYYGLATVLAG